MIKLVDINKIHHHPDNPRKDLGDLTELADSIMQNGVLQNLTLVPWFSTITGVGADDPKQQEEMGYYAVIGNRRLAASKLAGLTEVPAVIRDDMDHKTQVATMLLENMQRSDLTAYEQAQGFQMMIDLGESVAGISEKTGFSKSTVYSRMKLLELDQDKLKESAQRGATLMDYMELEKITDIELKNEVLEKIGTDDFKWSLRNAIDREKREKAFAEVIEKLKEFAEEKIGKHGNLKHVRYFNGYGNDEVVKPEDVDTVRYFYEAGPNYIALYKENIEGEKNTEADEERIKREQIEARKAKLNEISNRAYKLRTDFVKEISNTKARKNMDTIIEFTLYAMVEKYGTLGYVELAELLNVEIDDKEDDEIGIEWKDIASHIWKQPELNLLLVAYDIVDSSSKKYTDWNGKYRRDEELDYIYDFLQKLGYKMSEEEKQLQDGTHELFEEEI